MAKVPRLCIRQYGIWQYLRIKRLIVKDKQGITGLKSEIFSLPYKSIIMWSIENAGKIVDFNSEVVLWTRIGKFKIKLGVDIDVKKIDYLLASYIL